MITFEKTKTAQKKPIDQVKDYLVSLGINTNGLPIEVFSKNGEIEKIKIGNENKEIALTPQQKIAIQDNYLQLTEIKEVSK